MPDLTVVAGPSSQELAASMANHLNAILVRTELRVFSDGESKIRFLGNIGSKCVIVQSTHPPTDSHLMQAMMMAKKCADEGANVCAVTPYLAYSRQDKSFLEGEVVSIALVSKLFEAAGVDSVVTVDIHSKIALDYFKSIKNISAIPLLASHAVGMNLANPIAVSPDTGGAARAQDFAHLLNTDTIALRKTRDRNTGEVTIEPDIGVDVSGRDVILVDDMISTGGSIIKSTEVLKKAGAGKIYAMCTHALLMGDSTQRILAAGVNEIIATNSIPGTYARVDLSKVLADAVAEL